MPGISYAYAVGRIRALETSLLTSEQLKRMINADSAGEVRSLLGETDYGSKAAEMAAVYDYDQMLKSVMNETYQILKEVAPEPGLINLFFYRHDFHNLKALVKGKYSSQPVDHLLVDWGVIPVDMLKEAVENNNYQDIPPQAAAALQQIEQVFMEKEEPQLIDLKLDYAYYELIIEFLKKHPNVFIKEYFTIKVDLTNIRNYLRVKDIKSAPLEQIIIPGGRIPFAFFDKGENGDLLDRAGLGQYRPLLEQALDDKYQGAASALERLADDYLLKYIRESKGNPFGVEPLIGFLVAKEQEALALRIIFVGKINGIPPQVLERRVRAPYV